MSSTTVLAMALRAQVEMVCAALGPGGSGAGEPLYALAATKGLAVAVDDAMHALVRQARAAGATWQDIGDVLGTTRQAAYQRFRDTDQGDPMTAAITDASQRAVKHFELYRAGEWDALQADFDETMAANLSAAQLAAGWEQLLSMCGPFVSQGEPFERPTGQHVVVDLPLQFESAEMVGRVAYDAQGRVSGLFILTPPAAAALGV